MKKLNLLLSALFLAFAFSACSDSNNNVLPEEPTVKLYPISAKHTIGDDVYEYLYSYNEKNELITVSYTSSPTIETHNLSYEDGRLVKRMRIYSGGEYPSESTSTYEYNDTKNTVTENTTYVGFPPSDPMTYHTYKTNLLGSFEEKNNSLKYTYDTKDNLLEIVDTYIQLANTKEVQTITMSYYENYYSPWINTSIPFWFVDKQHVFPWEIITGVNMTKTLKALVVITENDLDTEYEESTVLNILKSESNYPTEIERLHTENNDEGKAETSIETITIKYSSLEE